MEKQKLDYSIADTYSFELEEIRNKLAQMESGRIYELSGAQMDGYLATNIRQLRKMIAVLLSKIQNGSEGTDEEIGYNNEIRKNRTGVIICYNQNRGILLLNN